MDKLGLISKECGKWILSQKFTKVGLEFPDDSEDAITLSKLIRNEVGFSPVILYDRNRACGNCCVDEGTAKPRNIEAIVHFGRTCLTPTRDLPVLYVLHPCISVNAPDVANSLLTEVGPKKDEDLILAYDTLCEPSIDSLASHLQKYYPKLILFKLRIPEGSTVLFLREDEVIVVSGDSETKNELDSLEIGSRKMILPQNKSVNDFKFIYIGQNNQSLVSLQMRFSDKTFFVVDPTNCSISVSNNLKVVMGRMRKIEQVKEAKTIGLLITLVQGHQEISNRLKKLIRAAGKRCYTFFMGKINEAKLGNIVGVDSFVYIGCPESSLFDRNENNFLYKHIVTPWELEVALRPSTEWSLSFKTDFKELLALNEDFVDVGKDEVKEEDTSIPALEDTSKSLVERNPGTLHKLHRNAAGEALLKLSWQGLNPNQEGSVPIGTIVEGKKGIALQYDSEPS